MIAKNSEEYISFNVKVDVELAGVKNDNGESVHKKIELRFIDSFRFMASSLDKLSANLTNDQCENLKREFPRNFELMRQKGVFPYEYMNSWGKFEETKLPPKEAFYSKLNLKHISEEDYKRAQKVWDSMEEKTLGCYHDTYLKTDVLLLADVFETFREVCLQYYKLDPANFYTTPGLAWQALLKVASEYCEHEIDGKCMKRVECKSCPKEFKLELLTDIDMFLFFEKGIRGGFTQAVKRYAKANNKYMVNLYDPEEVSNFIMYLDANNQYGWSMCNNLPWGGFAWVKNVEDFTPERIAKLVEKDKRGYVLEVDVDYPKVLHKKHNDLPFLPEKIKINKVEKLIGSLTHKRNYVVHIKKLNQALNHGLKLKKVHRVVKFEQSRWMKPYIMLNTMLRMKAKNEFEKNFFKLMNNSVFGKTMENVRNRKNIKLVTNRKDYLEYIMKPNFINDWKFTDEFFAVELGRMEITMKKPIYLGLTVLDLSKIIMYEFYYDYMQPKYGEKVKLCYMDTDSFVFEVETEDFFRDIADDIERDGSNCFFRDLQERARFDTSNYSKDFRLKGSEKKFPVGKNMKVIGFFKDELGGDIMTEFVALRAKMYAYKTLKKEDKKCKGTKKCVIAENIQFDDYKQCLFGKGDTRVYREQQAFEKKKHNVYTVSKRKVALDKNDDKRIIQDDGITTLARGYTAAA